MASGAALTEFITVKKAFSWVIDNVDDIRMKHLGVAVDKLGDKEITYPPHFRELLSPEMVSIDPFTGIDYIGRLKLRIDYRKSLAAIKLNCFPPLNVSYIYFQINDKKELHKGKRLRWNNNIFVKYFNPIKKLSIFVDYVAAKEDLFQVDSFKVSPRIGTFDRLKELWDDDSNIKITLKSGTTEIEAFKPCLAAHSEVFKKMFETDMKESNENKVEIEDFDGKIIQKMVEFCETNSIQEIDGLEADIFKIAHKYLIEDLMNFAMEKMSESVSKDTIQSFTELAKFYDLKEFEKWLIHFATRNNFSFA